jgi:Xaa-Pro aminopeptidase
MIFEERRKKLATMIDKGIAIIQSSERDQDNLYEYFVPDSNNRDFIFLTGLETPNATLILCPGSEEYPEILYISGIQEEIKKKTGIEHVYPPNQLMPDLSNAYTDFSLLRYSQRRWKSLPSEISRILSNNLGKKIIYFNFPRFVNLAETPPKRLELIQRIKYFSPKYEIRDASNLLDMLRMYHDEFGIKQLRKAAQISGEAMIECMKSTVPGMTNDQIGYLFNFICHFKGARSLGFPAFVRSGPGWPSDDIIQPPKEMKAGELVTVDAGAEVNYYTADIMRTFPVSGKFSEEQKKVYNILKKAQETCIKMVRPGVTMKDLQETAMRILEEEGGYGKYFKWGTGHFLGMDCHDHGNYLIPLKPGICITVEPGITMPELNIVMEDDVLCTEDGYECLTEFIPKEIDDIERVMQEKGIGEILFKKEY